MAKLKAREIVKYRGERVRVLAHIGNRVEVWIPSRQEAIWVKPKSLKRITKKK